MVEKLKNGSPATKALALFLLAPKGAIIFSPVLIKKLAAKTGLEISMAAIGMFGAKVAMGFTFWLMAKKIIRNKPFTKALKQMVDVMQVIETSDNREVARHSTRRYIVNGI